MSVFQNFTLFSSGPKETLWLLWLLMLLSFLVMSLIFSRAWKQFGVHNSALLFAEFIYYIISIFLLGFSALSLLLLNVNF